MVIVYIICWSSGRSILLSNICQNWQWLADTDCHGVSCKALMYNSVSVKCVSTMQTNEHGFLSSFIVNQKASLLLILSHHLIIPTDIPKLSLTIPCRTCHAVGSPNIIALWLSITQCQLGLGCSSLGISLQFLLSLNATEPNFHFKTQKVL